MDWDPKQQHTTKIIPTQKKQNRSSDPPTPPTMYQTIGVTDKSDPVPPEVDDGSMVDVVVAKVGVVMIGCAHNTPAASLSKQKIIGADGHSSKLFSLPVHSKSTTQIFPAPLPKRSAPSV